MMQKRLSRILRMKKAFEDNAEAEAQRIKRELDIEKQKLQGLQSELENVILTLNNMADSGPLDVISRELQYSRLYDLKNQIRRQMEVLNAKDKEYRDRKNRLIEIHKEKRTLERFLDRSLKKKMREELKRQQIEIDFDSLTRRLRDR